LIYSAAPVSEGFGERADFVRMILGSNDAGADGRVFAAQPDAIADTNIS
jgi:hypothetical protein